MPKKDVLVIATYGFVDDDPNNNGSTVTKERIAKAAQLMEEGLVPADTLVPFPQSTRKEGFDYLGENVAKYVRTLPAFASAHVHAFPLSNGTWNDLEATYQIARDRFGYQVVHFHFVSDTAHLARIWLIWQFTRPPKWTASFYAAKTGRRDAWKHEPLSYLKVIIRGIAQYFTRYFR